MFASETELDQQNIIITRALIDMFSLAKTNPQGVAAPRRVPRRAFQAGYVFPAVDAADPAGRLRQRSMVRAICGNNRRC